LKGWRAPDERWAPGVGGEANVGGEMYDGRAAGVSGTAGDGVAAGLRRVLANLAGGRWKLWTPSPLLYRRGDILTTNQIINLDLKLQPCGVSVTAE
jgi:hypothetical protein